MIKLIETIKNNEVQSKIAEYETFVQALQQSNNPINFIIQKTGMTINQLIDYTIDLLTSYDDPSVFSTVSTNNVLQIVQSVNNSIPTNNQNTRLKE